MISIEKIPGWRNNSILLFPFDFSNLWCIQKLRYPRRFLLKNYFVDNIGLIRSSAFSNSFDAIEYYLVAGERKFKLVNAATRVFGGDIAVAVPK